MALRSDWLGIIKGRGLVDKSLENGGRLLVVFDGHCGFCNRTVRWLLRRDRRDRLRFVASESDCVVGILARHGVDVASDADGPGSIVVVRDAGGVVERVLVGSDAVAALLCELRRPWTWVGVTLKWIPRPVRDMGYRLVARWRYRIWGRLESCTVPTAEERERFL
jgi:predicted DCC family thiol-disulfide oxidoreductase YuxK